MRALVLEELAAVDVAATLALDVGGPAALLLEAFGEEERGKTALVLDLTWALGVPADAYVIVSDGRACVAREAEVERAASIAFDALGCGAVRPRSERLLRDDAGALERGLAAARVHQAALLVGLSRAAWEHASRYAQDRVTFGRRLVDHQAVAFMLVEMAMAASVARLAVWRAASTGDAWQSRAALDEAREVALMCTDRAVQLLGGHGYLEDHPVEKWMREARALSVCWR